MAQFSMRVQVIKRSAGRSVIAAAAYRSGERLHDDRQGLVHDYSKRGGVERSEMLFPGDAPAWVCGISREAFWNAVDAGEKRKDAQTAREVRLMIPRELDPSERIRLVRDYVERCFVAKGMVADVCWHNKTASDGRDQPHAHVMLTMRPLVAGGFGNKVRHDWVPDPTGRTHPDGRPLMVESNAHSWNSAEYYENTCRAGWESMANEALARAGSDQRIDRRSLLERGLARLPEPALRLAYYLNDLRGSLKERFGQWQYARHYKAVEDRARSAFDVNGPLAGQRDDPTTRSQRFFGWFDRQLVRLDPPPRDHALTPSPPSQEPSHDR